jgi:cell division protein FtsZ
MLEFNMPKNKSSKIKVIGVGGGGTNAVNHMYRLGIKDVDIIIANTDRQSLDASPVLNKIQLGEKLTEGLGAGTNPDRGRDAAIESLTDIKELLSINTKMLFVTAGMGGGTGTGAAPVIAQAAKEMGLLTVGIVTTPFDYEGPKTRKQALEGIEELKKYVDAVIIVSNETLREEYGDMDIDNAYSKADDVLATAAKSIADCITAVGTQNVDFEDVRVALTNSGVAIIGNGAAEGADRARVATEIALDSKLLYDKDIHGARSILMNVSYGVNKIKLDELNEIALYVRERAGENVQIKQGRVFDETLGEKISVTIIAAGFSNGTSRANEVLQRGNNLSNNNFDVTPMVIDHTINQPTSVSVLDFSTPEKATDSTPEIQNHHEPIMESQSLTLDFSVNQVQENEVENLNAELNEDVIEEPVKLNEIVFEITNQNYLDTPSNSSVVISDEDAAELDRIRRANEEREMRKRQLKTMSYQFNQPRSTFNEKKLDLESIPHSSQNTFSEYTVAQNANGDYEVKRNPFLHDNVD